MRIVKVLLVALFALLAVVAGLFTALIAATTVAGLFFARRLGRGRSTSTSTVATRSQAPLRPARAEVIDIKATEVPTGPAS